MILLISTLLAGIASANVIIRPETATVPEGGNIRITCSEFISEDSFYSLWCNWHSDRFPNMLPIFIEDCYDFLYSGSLGDGTRYSLHCNNGGTFFLQLTNVSVARHGERWHCSTYNGDSANATISVKVPVTTVKMESTESCISTNESAHVSCSSSSIAGPAPFITWLLTDDPLNRANHTTFFGHSHGNTFQNEKHFTSTSELIVNYSKPLNGKYLYCAASDSLGTTVESKVVLISDKCVPNIQGLVYATIENANNETLACNTEIHNQTPLKTMMWDCNQESSNESDKSRTMMPFTGTPEEQRTCGCISRHTFTEMELVPNQQIYMEARVDLSVEGAEKDEYGRVEVLDDVKITFNCDITVRFIDLSNQMKWLNVMDTLSYTIDQISWDQAGLYTCYARTDHDVKDSSSFDFIDLRTYTPPRRYMNIPFEDHLLVYLGEPVTLSLTVIAYPRPRFAVYFGTETPTFSSSEEGKQLANPCVWQYNYTISNVTEANYGTYQFTATNALRLATYRQNVTLKQAPVTTVKMNSTKRCILRNEHAQVTCSSSSARQSSNITWLLTADPLRRENHMVYPGNSHVYINQSGEMFTSNSELAVTYSPSLNGKYLYCTASNRPGVTVESKVVLFSEECFQKVHGLILATIENKHNETLACNTEGDIPLRNVKWDCQECSDMATGSNISQCTGTSNWRSFCECLSHRAATEWEFVSDDNENIQSIRAVTSLLVNGEKKSIVEVTENDTVTFHCPSSRYLQSGLIEKEEEMANLTYSINKILYEQAGTYTCRARTSDDVEKPSVYYTSVQLRVKCAPRRYLNSTLQDKVFANIGETATLSVQVIAYPEPSYEDVTLEKLKNDEWVILTEVADSIYLSYPNASQINFIISRISEEDYGTYQLSVRNELGTYRQNFTLERAPGEGKTLLYQKQNKNVTSIVIGSVVGIVILCGIITAAICIWRKIQLKRKEDGLTTNLVALE